jgi:hypothetical protein
MNVTFTNSNVTVIVELDDDTFYDMARESAHDTGIDLTHFDSDSIEY